MSNLKLPDNKLSNRLLEERIGLDISQRDMAKRIGISYPTYRGLETGTYTVSLKILVKLAQYFEMDVEEALRLYINTVWY